MERFLKEYRCACGKLLFRGLLFLSIIEIKCQRCGVIRSFDALDSIIGPTALGLLVDMHGNIINVSKNAQNVLGYTPDELRRLSIVDIYPTINLAMYKRVITSRLISGVRRWKKISFYRPKNDACQPFFADSAVLDVCGAPYFFIILERSTVDDDRGKDFSDDAWFGEIANEWMFEMDFLGNITKLNEKMLSVLEYTVADLLGKSFDVIYPSMKALPTYTEIINAFSQRVSCHAEGVVAERKNSESILVDVYFALKYSESGIVGYRVFNWTRVV